MFSVGNGLRKKIFFTIIANYSSLFVYENSMIFIIKFLLLFTKNINFVFKKLPKQMFVFGLIVRKHQQASD